MDFANLKQKNDSISKPHPEYSYFRDIWEMVDDFVLGEKQVKQQGTLYLPMTPDWSDEQYEEYLELAPFTNFTGRTINALQGAMFLKEPLIKLPRSIEYLKDNADGKGGSLAQVIRRTGQENFKKGRAGLYVDFPRAESNTYAATRDLQASIVHYDALNILDWDEDARGLTYVKLQEQYRHYDANMSWSYKRRYRELRLVDGAYRVDVKDEGGQIEDSYVPMAQGQVLPFIPFQFVGSINNDSSCDTVPVYEIVSKNKTHFQIEAEIMRSIRLFNSPMLTLSIGDIPADQWMAINGLDNGGTLKFGGQRGLILGMQGDAKLLQLQENSLAQKKSSLVLEEAAMLGARLVTKSSGRATAEQIRIETSAENAVINSIAKNIEDAYQRVLTWCQMFMSQTVEDIIFSMNTEFYVQNPDAQLLYFAKEMVADPSNTFAPHDMFELLKQSGMIDANRTFDQVFGEAEEYKETLPEIEDESDDTDTMSRPPVLDVQSN